MEFYLEDPSIINHPKPQWLKTTTICLADDSDSCQFGLGSAEQFCWLQMGSFTCSQLTASQLGDSASGSQLAVDWGDGGNRAACLPSSSRLAQASLHGSSSGVAREARERQLPIHKHFSNCATMAKANHTAKPRVSIWGNSAKAWMQGGVNPFGAITETMYYKHHRTYSGGGGSEIGTLCT